MKPVYAVSDDQEIYKKDKGGNWYVFRHNVWDLLRREPTEGEVLFQHSSLAKVKERALVLWVENFEQYKIESVPEGFNKSNIYYTKGDEDAPFWSEGFLYPLVGKEDARSILARLRRLKDISQAY